MKQYMKWLLGFTAFILVLLGATLAYTKLSLTYVREQETNVSGKEDAGVGAGQEDTGRESAAQQSVAQQSEVIDFTMQNAQGETISFSQLLGKPVILNFWASWCGPCQSEMPHIQKAYEQYGEEINFVLVNLTDGKRETMDSVKEFIGESGYTFPVYYDTEMKGTYSYGAYSIPLTYFMDETGAVVSGRLGAMTEEDLFEQIRLLLGENE